jgi:hypothetical protein
MFVLLFNDADSDVKIIYRRVRNYNMIMITEFLRMCENQS